MLSLSSLAPNTTDIATTATIAITTTDTMVITTTASADATTTTVVTQTSSNTSSQLMTDNETGNEKGGLVCSMAGTGNVYSLLKQNHQMYVLHTYVVIFEKLKILQWITVRISLLKANSKNFYVLYFDL